MSDKVLVRKLMPNLWQWREVQAGVGWRSDEFFTGDINLLKETIEGRQVVLILPGQDIVSQQVDAELSDRKQLLKILPFELEEHIIDPVEDLHFVFGPIENETICVSYCDYDLLMDAINEIESAGAEIQKVVVDYLQLPLGEQGWSLLLENGVLIARTQKLVGFAVEQDLAPMYLSALSEQHRPERIQLYADSQENLYALNGLLPASLKDENGPELLEDEVGFWDLIAPLEVPTGDLRTGRLARKLPFAKWWNDFKVPSIAAAVAFVIALGTTWVGLSKAEDERRRIMAQTDEIFRQVVPKGNISDPERQLRGMLGKSSGPVGSTNVVYLISAVAPALKEFDGVEIRSLRYTGDSGELQMNLEAKTFADVENLRKKIEDKGFAAQIKSSNVVNDIQQAQIRVSEAG